MKEKNNEEKDSFIIDFWCNIFGILKKISIFEFVRWVTKKKGSRFVEYWVLGNLIAAILSTVLIYYVGATVKIVTYFIVAYGIIRVFEIIIYQLNVLLFDEYRQARKKEAYILTSVLRTVLLLIHNYIEVMFWYASIMLALLQLDDNTLNASWGEYVRSNILCVAVFDRSSIQELMGDTYSSVANIIFMEVISGVIMTLLSLARFIGIMPGVKTKKLENEEIDRD